MDEHTTMSIIDPGASSITVTVRVRPFTIREAAQLRPDEDGKLFLGDGSLAAPAPKLNQRGLRSVIKVVDDRCLVFDPPEDSPVQKFSRSVVPKQGKKVKDQVFAFDRVFDENTSQAEVYEGTTKDLLDSVLDGYNATVFAYGATGCGKTHTITGTAQQPGIIFMTMQELFEKIQDRRQEKSTEVSLSYLEIYNETIRDLLVPGGSKQGLSLREDSQHSVTVAGLTSHHPRDVQQVMDMIVLGNEYRTVSPTAANATSSRSHAVLQINVAQKDRNAAVHEPHTMATLSIIDLAGSERASATLNRGERLLEGANINKSLLALGSCINALCDPRKSSHVPYRNSKLTRLLKFSLGGNCKTVMIVCVSPSSAHFDETQNTLRYANRAKNIQTKVTRNVFNVNRHVKDFLVKIDEQMALINELKAQQKEAEGLFMQKFRKQLERREATAREGVQRLRVAYDNAAAERQEKIDAMKMLRGIERRIMLLTALVAAFDSVCEKRGGSGDDMATTPTTTLMPTALSTMKRTAQGVLSELESSRQHTLQRANARTGWERALDTTLQHAIKQLADSADADNGEAEMLAREASLLKATFQRDATQEVLDQDRAGDAAATQALLTAQFEILASLSDVAEMDDEEATEHCRNIIISKLLQTGLDAASQLVKGDGLAFKMADLPPPKKGTPRKRSHISAIKASALPTTTSTTAAESGIRTISQPTFAVSHANLPPIVPPSVTSMNDESVYSPLKSPRRRKAHPTRKGINFTPAKRKPVAPKRAVRWRDDDGEELADFEKTPQQVEDDESPAVPSQLSRLVASPAPSPSKQLRSPSGSSLPVLSAPSSSLPVLSPSPRQPSSTAYDAGNDSTLSLPDSSPSLRLPDTTSIPAAKPNRFQAGFLSKSRLSSTAKNGSPKASLLQGSPETRLPSLSSLSLSSDAEDGNTRTSPQPLRTLSPGKISNLSPPTFGLKRSFVPRRSLSSQMDENGAPPPSSGGESGSPTANNTTFNNTNNNNNNAAAAATATAPPAPLNTTITSLATSTTPTATPTTTMLPPMAPPPPPPPQSTTMTAPAARRTVSALPPIPDGMEPSHLFSGPDSIDPLKVRSALQAKRGRRISLAPATNSSVTGPARRLSGVESIRRLNGVEGSRASVGPGFVVASNASATNGIRRKSLDRAAKKSPPMPCTPDGFGRSFTAGQARRFNFGSLNQVVGNAGGAQGMVGVAMEGFEKRRASMGAGMRGKAQVAMR